MGAAAALRCRGRRRRGRKPICRGASSVGTTSETSEPKGRGDIESSVGGVGQEAEKTMTNSRVLSSDVDDRAATSIPSPASPADAEGASRSRRKRRRRIYGRECGIGEGDGHDGPQFSASASARGRPVAESPADIFCKDGRSAGESSRRATAVSVKEPEEGAKEDDPFDFGPCPMQSSSASCSPSKIAVSSSTIRKDDAESSSPSTLSRRGRIDPLRSLPCLIALRESGWSSCRAPTLLPAIGPCDVGPFRGGGRTEGGWRRRWATRVLRRPMEERKGNGDRRFDEVKRQCYRESSTSSLPTARRGSRRWEWRPYAQRSIPFSRLRTPPYEALLAMDRWGSYLVCLGGGGGAGRMDEGVETMDQGRRPVLALRFYGLPSPASMDVQGRLRRLKQWGRVRSADSVSDTPPLLLTVPLHLHSSGDSNENRNYTAPSSLLGESMSATSWGVSAAATTPVRILTSADGAIGAAFLHHSTPHSSMDAGASMTPRQPASSLSSLPMAPATRDEDILGTIVVFALPPNGVAHSSSSSGMTHRRTVIKSHRCANVRVGGMSAHTMRNLLWPVSLVPHRRHGHRRKGRLAEAAGGGDEKRRLCDSFLETNGRAYLLLNDEDDGYRLTWLVIGSGEEAEGRRRTVNTEDVPPLDPPCEIAPGRSDIVTTPDQCENAWEEVRTDASNGFQIPNNDESKPGGAFLPAPGVEVAFEAYLNVEALLGDIVVRRRRLLSPMLGVDLRIPDFFYNLVSISDSGCAAVLVVVFGKRQSSSAPITKTAGNNKVATSKSGGKSKTPPPAAVGIFLRVDLIDQSYSELEWVRHPSRCDIPFLKSWKDALALNWRMREVGVGPYCRREGGGEKVDGKENVSRPAAAFRKFGVGTHESNTGEGEADDVDLELWEEFDLVTKTGSSKSSRAQKEVSMSSLYPRCDFIGNRAVTSGSPVSRIACRNAPVELIYG